MYLEYVVVNFYSVINLTDTYEENFTNAQIYSVKIVKMANEQFYEPKKRSSGWIIILSIITATIVVFLVWATFFKPDKKVSNQNVQPSPSSNAPASSVDALISYSLPAGWKTISCNDPQEVVLFVPDGKVSPTCTTLAGSWPTKLLVDPQNTRDCNQIKVNNQQVTSHTCSSKFINGNKVLVSDTSYNDKSAYGKNIKVADYYILTDKGVAHLYYADDASSPDDDYQAEFDQIINSIKSK
jgi:hypothetical protein